MLIHVFDLIWADMLLAVVLWLMASSLGSVPMGLALYFM